MKFYRIDIIEYPNILYKILHFPKGKEFKNFDYYFDNIKNIKQVEGYNKDNQAIYIQYNYKDFKIYIYRKKETIGYYRKIGTHETYEH